MKNLIIAVLTGVALIWQTQAQEQKAPAHHWQSPPLPAHHQGQWDNHSQGAKLHHWNKTSAKNHKEVQASGHKGCATHRKHSFKFGPTHRHGANFHKTPLKAWGKKVQRHAWGKCAPCCKAWGKCGKCQMWGKMGFAKNAPKCAWGRRAHCVSKHAAHFGRHARKH